MVSVAGLTSKGRGDIAQTDAFFTEEGGVCLMHEIIIISQLSLDPKQFPNNISVHWSSGECIVVSWMPLTLVESRGFIIHYTVKLEPFQFADNTVIGSAVGGHNRLLNTAPNTTYIAVCEVMSDHGYYVSVSATTAAGEGPSARLSLLPLIGQSP